jgi:hypothetical protein
MNPLLFTAEHRRLSAAVLALGFFAAGRIFAQAAASTLPPPVTLTAQEDIKRLCALLHVEPILVRPPYNYDEAKANPYPNLPDPLVLKNGEKVTDARTWWEKRRPEILEDFEREVYGRTPKTTPKVTWTVTDTAEGENGGFPTVTKQLVGHVDNASYPLVSVDIRVTLTTPARATGPVPVMLQFSPGSRPRPPAPAAGAAAPASTPGPRAGTAPGPAATAPAAPPWQQQLLAKGWGYAVLDTGSVQADNGAGLTAGIIGLVNRGQPRTLEDWGVLAAWAWGASRTLDYLETDAAVDAKQVGLEGHSRWGKATIVAMALDQRFAIAYVSSSGEGGAKLHRRNFGQPLNAVTIPEEYHWLGGNFLKYAQHWDDLPVDSHELIALCAPRPVFISGGAQNGDRIVDPKGSFLAAVAAGPVYRLLGRRDLGTTEMPAVNVPVIDGDLAFRLHDGGHTDVLNWPTFIEFASRYLKTPAPKAAASGTR